MSEYITKILLVKIGVGKIPSTSANDHVARIYQEWQEIKPLIPPSVRIIFLPTRENIETRFELINLSDEDLVTTDEVVNKYFSRRVRVKLWFSRVWSIWWGERVQRFNLWRTRWRESNSLGAEDVE